MAVPSSIESRYSRTVQTHSNVSVPASGLADSVYVDLAGFDKIGIIVKSDTDHSSRVKCLWSFDGVSGVTENDTVLSISVKDGKAEIPVVAPYVKIQLRNDDSATAHIMSAWLYLKS